MITTGREKCAICKWGILCKYRDTMERSASMIPNRLFNPASKRYDLFDITITCNQFTEGVEDVQEDC